MPVKAEKAGPAEVDLGPLCAYSDPESISIEEARALVRGRKGRVALDVIRRWAKKGCRPCGPDGPLLKLPALKMSGALRTMPDWVRAFESRRQELGRPQQAKAVPARAGAPAHRASEAYLDRAGVG